MKKKFLISFLAIIFTLNICTFGTFAISDSVYPEQSIDYCPYPELHEIISLNEGDSIILNDTVNPLFWEFSEYDNAFLIMIEFNKDILSRIASRNSLSQMNANNWKEYQEEFLTLYPEDNYNQESKNEKILHQFFIVCENHEINKQIKNIYKQRNYNLMELVSYLPYTSPVINDLKSQQETKLNASTRGYSEGISYAKKYATNPNIGSYNYYNGADCTNFVSQILKASGVTTDSDWQPYTSKWINAHSFTLYWYMKRGVSNGYPSFASVSAVAKVGNVISVDYQSDGRYDHVGYVVATGSKTSSGYYDITIAQHTSNYCEKVSSSKNGWENTRGLYVRLPI